MLSNKTKQSEAIKQVGKYTQQTKDKKALNTNVTKKPLSRIIITSNNNFSQTVGNKGLIKNTINENVKNLEYDSNEKCFQMRFEANLTNRQINFNNEPAGQKNLKTLLINSKNKYFKKPIGKTNEQILSKLINSHTLNAVAQYNTTNVCINNKSEKHSNTNTGQFSPPLKFGPHFSNLTNNMNTNNIDNLREPLLIKTSSLENESIVPSPLSFKTIVNNLKAILSKLTPTNQSQKKFLFNDENIKILEVNEENTEKTDLLYSIRQFVVYLKTNITVNLKSINELNNAKFLELNELLKSTELVDRKEEVIKCDIKKPLHSTKNSKVPSFGNEGQKPTLDNNKLGVNNKKKAKKFGLNLFSPVSKSAKINFELKLSNQNSSSTTPNEPKVNSAKTRERILNEIYTNSDQRIKKYRTFLDFLVLNLKDIKEMITSPGIIENPNINITEVKSQNFFNCGINFDLNSHQKKISPTSNDIEKLAREINEDKSFKFSSISILNSTFKKARLDDCNSNNILEVSKNITHNSPKADFYDFNESDIQEYDIEEYFKSPRYNNNNHMNNGITIIVTGNKRNSLNNLSKSFFISSINSDFYNYFVEETYQIYNENNISNDMSLLKAQESGLCELFEQSTIKKKNISNISEDLEKTRENFTNIKINPFHLKKVDYEENVDVKSVTIKSNKESIGLQISEKIESKIVKNSENNSMVPLPPQKDEKDIYDNFIIYYLIV